MSDPCVPVLIMAIIASALPAIFCSMAIIVTLLMLDKISGRDAILLSLAVILLAFVPTMVDYVISSKVNGTIQKCYKSMQQAPKQSMPTPSEQAIMMAAAQAQIPPPRVQTVQQAPRPRVQMTPDEEFMMAAL